MEIMYMWKKRTRRGMTGLETAIILVAFVITAAAFSFVVLNMGFLTAGKTQSVIAAGMQEASSAMLIDGSIIGHFANTTKPDQSLISMTKAVFYLKISQGHEPIDMDDSKLVVTYTNERCHGEIYSEAKTNGTIMTVTSVTGDGNSLLELGEKFKLVIDFTALGITDVDPAQSAQRQLYAHPYEEFRIELRPAAGAVLTIEKQVPAIYSTVVTIE